MAGHTGPAEADGNVTVPPPADGDGVVSHLVQLVDWLTAPEQIVFVRLAATLLILITTIALARFVRRQLRASAERTARRSRLDDWRTRALVSRTRPLSMAIALALYLAAAIMLLGLWQMQTAFVSLLTAAGFLGIVIGIAAASSLSNLIAGFMIFYNHPFDIGDWVEIDDMQGIVVDVKPGATVIESWDGEKVTYPNRIIESSRIKNKSHQRKLRWRIPVGVDYATDIEKARDILLKIISSHPEVLKDPEPQVIALAFGDSSINLEVRFWIAPLRARVLLIQTWFMQETQRAFAKEGIVIPFPQRTVVWRFPDGNAPPGETVSRLAYDAKTDPRPVPAPPLDTPLDTTSPYAKQDRSPFFWFDRFLRREGRKAAAAGVRERDTQGKRVGARAPTRSGDEETAGEPQGTDKRP